MSSTNQPTTPMTSISGEFQSLYERGHHLSKQRISGVAMRALVLQELPAIRDLYVKAAPRPRMRGFAALIFDRMIAPAISSSLLANLDLKGKMELDTVTDAELSGNAYMHMYTHVASMTTSRLSTLFEPASDRKLLFVVDDSGSSPSKQNGANTSQETLRSLLAIQSSFPTKLAFSDHMTTTIMTSSTVSALGFTSEVRLYADDEESRRSLEEGSSLAVFPTGEGKEREDVREYALEQANQNWRIFMRKFIKDTDLEEALRAFNYQSPFLEELLNQIRMASNAWTSGTRERMSIEHALILERNALISAYEAMRELPLRKKPLAITENILEYSDARISTDYTEKDFRAGKPCTISLPEGLMGSRVHLAETSVLGGNLSYVTKSSSVGTLADALAYLKVGPKISLKRGLSAAQGATQSHTFDFRFTDEVMRSAAERVAEGVLSNQPLSSSEGTPSFFKDCPQATVTSAFSTMMYTYLPADVSRHLWAAKVQPQAFEFVYNPLSSSHSYRTTLVMNDPVIRGIVEGVFSRALSSMRYRFVNSGVELDTVVKSLPTTVDAFSRMPILAIRVPLPIVENLSQFYSKDNVLRGQDYYILTREGASAIATTCSPLISVYTELGVKADLHRRVLSHIITGTSFPLEMGMSLYLTTYKELFGHLDLFSLLVVIANLASGSKHRQLQEIAQTVNLLGVHEKEILSLNKTGQ